MCAQTHSFPPKFSKEQVVLFSFNALQSIKHLDSTFILDGLVRVDICYSEAEG